MGEECGAASVIRARETLSLVHEGSKRHESSALGSAAALALSPSRDLSHTNAGWSGLFISASGPPSLPKEHAILAATLIHRVKLNSLYMGNLEYLKATASDLMETE